MTFGWQTGWERAAEAGVHPECFEGGILTACETCVPVLVAQMRADVAAGGGGGAAEAHEQETAAMLEELRTLRPESEEERAAQNEWLDRYFQKAEIAQPTFLQMKEAMTRWHVKDKRSRRSQKSAGARDALD